jgi:hypothetical protein
VHFSAIVFSRARTNRPTPALERLVLAIPARLPGVGIAVHSMLGMLEFELPQVEEMALRCS